MLRIKVGSYIPDHPDSFEAKLREFLTEQGKISDVEGRGLELYWARHKSEPGSNLMKIAEALNAAPRPLSKRKLLNRLTDIDEPSLMRALMKMVKDGEVNATPAKLNGYKYFMYSLSPDGVEAWKKRREAFDRGKPMAVEIWRLLRLDGARKGDRVDPQAIGRAIRSTMENSEFWAGWRTLVTAGRIDVAYNAEGPGKHAYFLA